MEPGVGVPTGKETNPSIDGSGMPCRNIAIVGTGIAGSSLYHLLSGLQKVSRIRVDLYGQLEHHSCGIHPCGWMTHVPEFNRVLRVIGLSGEKYILQPFSCMNFDGFPIPCNLATIDKPALLRDLQGQAEIIEGPVDIDAYDVVVDCTGASRALLPSSKDDLITPTLQYRLHRNSPHPDSQLPVIRFVKIGYAWSFPLGLDQLHVGIGSLTEELPGALRRAGMVHPGDTILCRCRSGIRVGAPHRMTPIHHGNIWGVGESIGTVSPLVGDGIVPSLECASLFADHLRAGSLDRYPREVFSRFAWMEAERKVIDRMIIHDGRVSLRDLLLMRNHAHRFGLHLSTQWIVSWISDRGRTEEE